MAGQVQETKKDRLTLHGIIATIIADIDFTAKEFTNIRGVLGVDSIKYSEQLPESTKLYGSNNLHAQMNPVTGAEYTGELATYDADIKVMEEAWYSSIRNTNGTVQRSDELKPIAMQFIVFEWNEDKAENLPRAYTFFRCKPTEKNWEFKTDSDSAEGVLMTIPLEYGTVSFTANENGYMSPYLITNYEDAPEWFDAAKYLTEIITPTTDFTVTTPPAGTTPQRELNSEE